MGVAKHKTKTITISAGRTCAVDAEDYPWLMKYRWTFHHSGYAFRTIKKNGKQKNILMHREILGAVTGENLDHIDGDGLNNKKSNLRFCSFSQNGMNQRVQSGRKFKGTQFKNGKYHAHIKISQKQIFLGSFETERDAVVAYNVAAKLLFKEFARINEQLPSAF